MKTNLGTIYSGIVVDGMGDQYTISGYFESAEPMDHDEVMAIAMDKLINVDRPGNYLEREDLDMITLMWSEIEPVDIPETDAAPFVDDSPDGSADEPISFSVIDDEGDDRL